MENYRKSRNMFKTANPKMRFVGVATLVVVNVFLGLAAATRTQANLIINGDIENNTASGSQFNMSNATFNAIVADATAFGTSEEIDLITALDFGIAPQSGNWKLGLHQRTKAPTQVDAFSFDLSSSVVSGNTYNLQFYAAGLYNVPFGPVEIGLSDNATSFGTLIFSGTPTSSSAWTQFNHVFVAPFNVSFLTVRNAVQHDMYAFVDNFSLVPEPATLLLLGLGAVMVRRKR